MIKSPPLAAVIIVMATVAVIIEASIAIVASVVTASLVTASLVVASLVVASFVVAAIVATLVVATLCWSMAFGGLRSRPTVVTPLEHPTPGPRGRTEGGCESAEVLQDGA